MSYTDFLKAKAAVAVESGFPCEPGDCHPILLPHQKVQVAWAVRGGRRAIFSSFGLGKTLIQLETVRLTLEKSGGRRGLIIIPLGVRQEFVRDAAMLGMAPKFVRTTGEASEPGLYLTNYESVREGKIDPTRFDCVSLDEASCLRGFGGTKTFREFMRLFEDTPIPRFVATATPSPNEFIELLAYSAFLGVMDVGQAKTRFFRRNSEKADQLTIHPHKEREFWLWVSTWAMFVSKPSDLGFSDEGYELPPIEVRWHEVPTVHTGEQRTGRGQHLMFQDAAMGVTHAAKEKRESLESRIAKLMEIRAAEPDEHRIVWHDLEDERRALEAAVPTIRSVYGSQDLDEREQTIVGFSDGEFRELAAKPVIAGSGCNFQRHCARAVYLGIGFKFNDFIQSLHRIQRFQQKRPVVIDLIYTEAERGIRQTLERKWDQHNHLVQKMTEIIKEYGLSQSAAASELVRGIGVDRQVAEGKGWTMVNNDCVDELSAMADSSVGLIVTSIPFATQYEYSPNYADFGHTDDNEHFWEQMSYMIPEALRVLKPGRVAAVHVKDRVTPGGINGLGFQTITPFSDETIREFTAHGFAFIGRKTVVTDVVRENNQTYRLGWSEQCKDGSKMGAGLPEYVLLFRKPPTDRSKSYADEPVTKEKRRWSREEECWEGPEDGYSRAEWQFDAHGFTRSSGDRPLLPEDLQGLEHDQMFRLFRDWSLESVYDHHSVVKLAEYLETEGKLPSTFMLLQPTSWHPDVWTDIARMRTLNMLQSRKGKEMHLCPLQFDIVERLIRQFSNEEDLVLDPFAGLGTVPMMAIKMGRRGYGIELNPSYWADALGYLKATERDMAIPSLFDAIEVGA